MYYMFCDRKNDNIVWLYVLLLSGSPFNGHPLFNEHIVKSLKLRPFSYCKFDLYQVVTSIQQTQSAFRIIIFYFQLANFIVFYLYKVDL